MDRKRRVGFLIAVGLLAISSAGAATTAELYFSYDKNGQDRVTRVQEGEHVWFVVYDPDENIDCDVRDKIWTELKLVDPKTGAHSLWVSYMDENGDANGAHFEDDAYVSYRGHWPGADAGWLGADYLEETGPDTGLFVSNRAFQVGTRENTNVPRMNTHVVCNAISPVQHPHELLYDFTYGALLYENGLRRILDETLTLDPFDHHHVRNNIDEWTLPDAAVRQNPRPGSDYLVGRFENMDTLVGMYQDQNDDGDVAVTMMKIIDVEATIAWNREIYPDCNEAATIIVEDADENLDCSAIEFVPVFIIVNPGSWNPVQTDPNSPTTFCALKRTGGVEAPPNDIITVARNPIRWYNIYHSEANSFGNAGARDGRYYLEYPNGGAGANVVSFDTILANGSVAVSFYAQETGPNTGVFQLNLNEICEDLGFNSLNVRDVLVAYYLDPNDFDDFKLAVAYIEERQHSITSFVDEQRQNQDLYWIGRDPIYVQVIDENANVDPCCPEQVIVHLCDPHGEDDAEWWILDESSSNSPVFLSQSGMALLPVWDALGIGIDPPNSGGFQLQLDNWVFEVFNEDDVYARYNDVQYLTNQPPLLGNVDVAWDNAFPPTIDYVRSANDVSFDLMSIGDTQVFDGESTQMWFLDRAGSRISEYASSDCLFVQVLDPDQDEDILRRERIDAYWDGGQGASIGPMSLNPWDCGTQRRFVHYFNRLFGDTNIFNDAPAGGPGVIFDLVAAQPGDVNHAGWGKVYVANPRNGRWAGIDLLETGTSTGEFTSVSCIDLIDVYPCVPTLGVLPGDTIVAVYQDPTNHSDSAWISIKVDIGGGEGPSGTGSTTTFVDEAGAPVGSYEEGDLIYVLVTDPSQPARMVLGGLTVEGEAYDLYPVDGAPGVFMTEGLDLGLVAGETLVATYTDPNAPDDTSSATASVVGGELAIERFFAAPSPFAESCFFGFVGYGMPTMTRVGVFDLGGGRVWSAEVQGDMALVWDGRDEDGNLLANGSYLYVIEATDGTKTFRDRGLVFIQR